jgi:EAL domain-containing protein (putative c-di-GMP-specific phosphodiesterase class I)
MLPNRSEDSAAAAVPAPGAGTVGQGHAPASIGQALGQPAGHWVLSGRPAPDYPVQRIVASGEHLAIGRHEQNGLCLPNPTVSGRHADLTPLPDGLLVRDLGSTNGTFVNGRRVVEPALVGPGDVIQFGTAVYHVEHVADGRAERARSTECADVIGGSIGQLQFSKLLGQPAVIPFFQPIVRLPDGERVGYEVLARSRLIGLETPGPMFRIAAERNAEEELSCLVRRQALEAGRGFGTAINFYLNTHPAELSQPGLIEAMRTLRSQYPGRPMTLEVHEAAVTDAARLRTLRDEMRSAGIDLAYDDFGAGQARLLELADAPPDVLKFDIHLIRGLPESPRQRQQLVESLVRVTTDLGIVPLAEGIETAAEAEVCSQLGFRLAQGYHFGHPKPAEAWLAAERGGKPT